MVSVEWGFSFLKIHTSSDSWSVVMFWSECVFIPVETNCIYINFIYLYKRDSLNVLNHRCSTSLLKHVFWKSSDMKVFLFLHHFYLFICFHVFSMAFFFFIFAGPNTVTGWNKDTFTHLTYFCVLSKKCVQIVYFEGVGGNKFGHNSTFLDSRVSLETKIKLKI